MGARYRAPYRDHLLFSGCCSLDTRLARAAKMPPPPKMKPAGKAKPASICSEVVVIDDSDDEFMAPSKRRGSAAGTWRPQCGDRNMRFTQGHTLLLTADYVGRCYRLPAPGKKRGRPAKSAGAEEDNEGEVQEEEGEGGGGKRSESGAAFRHAYSDYQAVNAAKQWKRRHTLIFACLRSSAIIHSSG